LPLPLVGDQVYWNGAVTIVERWGPNIDRIASDEPLEEDDVHYTLKWLDRRYFASSDPLIPPEQPT
jgi:hypothetical protein